MKKLLLAIGMLLILTSCSSKSEKQILGKWESSGVIIVEFTKETVVWIDGGCKHSGYKSEKKQVNGEHFEVVEFTCKTNIADEKPLNLTLNVVLVNEDTIVFARQELFRVK